MAIIYECDDEHPLQPGDVDGMAYMLDEDTPLETDWDIAFENPPHRHYDGPDLHAETKD